MSFYLFQGRYTADSLQSMIDKPQDREAAAAKAVEAAGGKLHHFFFCFGSEDVVALIEAPGDIEIGAVSMLVGASGSMSGGATTKLIPMKDAMAAMKLAKEISGAFSPANE